MASKAQQIAQAQQDLLAAQTVAEVVGGAAAEAEVQDASARLSALVGVKAKATRTARK